MGSVRQQPVDFEFSQHRRVVASGSEIHFAVRNSGHGELDRSTCLVAIACRFGAIPQFMSEVRGVVSVQHGGAASGRRSEEHTSELQSLAYLVCRLLLEKKNKHPIYVSSTRSHRATTILDMTIDRH